MKHFILICLFVLTACGDGFEKESKKPYTDPLVDGQAGRRHRGEKYLDLVNEHRMDRGTQGLVWNDIIEENAYRHSKAMGMRTSAFGHSGMNIRCRWIRNRLGFPKGSPCGEIVARGQKDYQAAFRAWMNSPMHRRTLQNPAYTHSALGIYKAEDGTMYWTQIFIGSN